MWCWLSTCCSHVIPACIPCLARSSLDNPLAHAHCLGFFTNAANIVFYSCMADIAGDVLAIWHALT